MKKRHWFILLIPVPIAFVYVGLPYEIRWCTQVGVFLFICYIAIGLPFGPREGEDG